MGHFPWRTVSHNQRVNHLVYNLGIFSYSPGCQMLEMSTPLKQTGGTPWSFTLICWPQIWTYTSKRKALNESTQSDGYLSNVGVDGSLGRSTPIQLRSSSSHRLVSKCGRALPPSSFEAGNIAKTALGQGWWLSGMGAQHRLAPGGISLWEAMENTRVLGWHIDPFATRQQVRQVFDLPNSDFMTESSATKSNIYNL